MIKTEKWPSGLICNVCGKRRLFDEIWDGLCFLCGGEPPLRGSELIEAAKPQAVAPGSLMDDWTRAMAEIAKARETDAHEATRDLRRLADLMIQWAWDIEHEHVR